MSRNFDLLQRAERNKNLFQTCLRLPSVPAAKPVAEDRASDGPRPKHLAAERRVPPERAKEEPFSGSRSSKAAPSQWLALLRAVSERLGIGSHALRHNGGGQLKWRAVALQEENKLVERLFFSPNAGANHVVVFSGFEDGGSARLCARVAETLASQVQGSVCVVDANVGSPTLHDYFGAANISGLSEALLHGGLIRLNAQQLTAENLWLIPCGAAATESWTALNPDRVRLWMEELRTQFDYVLIAGPSMNESNHSIVLGQSADGLIFILEANSTRRETALRLKKRLEEANVQILGVVLNNRTFPLPESVYRRF